MITFSRVDQSKIFFDRETEPPNELVHSGVFLGVSGEDFDPGAH